MSYQFAMEEPSEFDDFVAPSSGRAFDQLVGQSEALEEVLVAARRAARRSGGNILLVGETGTGKELLARAIHASGPSGDAPFLMVDCSVVPAPMLEGELFGRERGVVTEETRLKEGLFELAGGGTLFLDHVERLSLDLQPKLLRALDERRVRRVGGLEEIDLRCRIVAATAGELDRLVASGRFREDLAERLGASRIPVPPVRDRGDDVIVLAEHFAVEESLAAGLPEGSLTHNALQTLCAHDWPGNVRELKSVIREALTLCEGEPIRPEHLRLRRGDVERRGSSSIISVPDTGRTLRSVERDLVRITLGLTDWNKSAAARALGVSRPTLHRKVDDYGLEEEA